MASIQTRFRQLMGRFVTGITVIAVQSDDEPISAMTANAVSAVSLNPLLLLCCIRNESRMLHAVLARGRFSVNVLSAGQGDISRHYGGQRLEETPAVWLRDESGTPILEGANASFVCRVDSHCLAGDHTVIFGAVEDMQAAEQPAPALVYAGGRYRDLALAAS
ncbi:flavin reductase family protein [Pollutimonas thiosulfatoxidans]|uniref:Flavin reductase like domain-containing protein n=1 Tax=Pollutimonas thiosulfatoxidans TaxID=2028345 RepID=A0A410GG88_9BURK|nr:flavin reductase family protein [Pollutimonas thiosulfatoxidans]QAA95323.1 hypothetical protein CKA81_16735 [Pollutimonas thiosulfatoxidans]